MEKTLGQLKTARAQPPESWSIVKSLTSRAASYGPFDADAIRIATDEIGPAMDRQIAALEALAPKATSEAGVRGRPDGEVYGRRGRRAYDGTCQRPALSIFAGR